MPAQMGKRAVGWCKTDVCRKKNHPGAFPQNLTAGPRPAGKVSANGNSRRYPGTHSAYGA